MRLTRSRDDVVVAGVLAGLGEYFNIDPTILRIGFVILAFIGVGFVIPLYIAATIIIPKEPYGDRDNRRESRFAERSKRQKSRRQKRTNYDTMNRDDNFSSSSKSKNIDEEDWSDF